MAMEDDRMKGFYNATSPNPITNKEMTKQMVKTLGKRALVLPAPESTLRLGMGEMADVVLNSNRILPEKIAKVGFRFEYPDFPEALKDLVARKI